MTHPPQRGPDDADSHSGEENPVTQSTGRISTMDSLKIRDFRWLWLGAMASYTAMNMQMVTRGWLILRLTDDSPFSLSLIMVAFAAPIAIISPFGGAMADRFSKRRLIVLSQTGSTVITVIIAALDLTGTIRVWHVLASGVVNGSLVAINMPSRQAFISDLVQRNQLMNAISLTQSGANLSRIVGPALSGMLIIYLDTCGVFFVIAGFYAASALSATIIRQKGHQKTPSRNAIWADISAGFSYAMKDNRLRGLIIMLFVPALFGFPGIALLPAWGKEVLNVQSDGLGYLMMSTGIGALIGSLILASFSMEKNRGTWLIGICFSWGISIAAFSLTETYGTAMSLLFASGLFNSLFMSMTMTLIQTYSTAQMMGRVASIGMMTFGIVPLSVIPFGAMAEKTGTPLTYGLCGLCLILFTAVFITLARDFRKIQ